LVGPASKRERNSAGFSDGDSACLAFRTLWAERIRHETFASEMTQFRKGDIADIEVRPLLALARARRLAHAHLRET
jgi:uncharacterized Rossmann fold enzyme